MLGLQLSAEFEGEWLPLRISLYQKTFHQIHLPSTRLRYSDDEQTFTARASPKGLTTLKSTFGT